MKTILLIVSLFCTVVSQENILCSQRFCDEHLTQNTCRDLPSNCYIQNVTHNGIFLPHPGPCNCCDYCLENLDEGDACPVGTAGSSVPTIICGSGLACTIIDTVTTCQGIITECTIAQAKYDEKRQSGELGHLEERPMCDRNGLYERYKCIPGEICYCLSEEGERLFGEIPFTSTPQHFLNCECSRGYSTASKTAGRNLHPGEYLRCQSDGNFDTLQCIGDNCFCVHSTNGSPNLSDINFVNITLISNETLQCFNNETHMEGEYYRECEAQYIEILNEITEYEEMGFSVFGYVFPNCQLDGFYAAVQRNATHAYCADQHARILEDFIVNISDISAESMNCKCARSRSIASFDKPDCFQNGNYKGMQCRRGYCRCVDEDGNQLEKEVPFSYRAALSCHNEE